MGEDCRSRTTWATTSLFVRGVSVEVLLPRRLDGIMAGRLFALPPSRVATPTAGVVAHTQVWDSRGPARRPLWTRLEDPIPLAIHHFCGRHL